VFITLEGPDGSGKSMQVPALTEFIHSLGYEVLSTREPGGTYIGDQIREIIMRMDNKSMHPRTEILLFAPPAPRSSLRSSSRNWKKM